LLIIAQKTDSALLMGGDKS